MGIFLLLLVVLLFIAAGFLFTWVVRTYFVGTPPIIVTMVWIFLGICILILLLNALGVTLPHDPKVPKLN